MVPGGRFDFTLCPLSSPLMRVNDGKGIARNRATPIEAVMHEGVRKPARRMQAALTPADVLIT